MIIIEGKVHKPEGKFVTVESEKKFVLNFSVSQYIGRDRQEKAMYRYFAVSIWDKRAEALDKILVDKTIVAIKSDHYRAEAFPSKRTQDGFDAKLKIEIRATDKLDILHTPGEADQPPAENAPTEKDKPKDSGEEKPQTANPPAAAATVTAPAPADERPQSETATAELPTEKIVVKSNFEDEAAPFD